MKKILLFLSLITLAILTVAQSPEIERLKKELNNHKKQDTFRVNRLNDLATNTELSSSERLNFANEAMAISDNVKYQKGRGYAYMLLGDINISEGKITEGKILFLKADSIAQKLNNLELQAELVYRMAILATDEQEKIRLFLKTDSIATKTSNYKLQAKILANMATVALNDRDSKALNQLAFSKAEKSGDVDLQCQILFILGRSLASKGDTTALSYYLKAEKIAKNAGNKTLLSRCQSAIGIYYLSYVSDYAKAMEYVLKQEHSAEDANDLQSLISSWINLGSIYSYLGDQDNALVYLTKAEEGNKTLKDNWTEYILQSSFGERYRLQGKYPEAIKAYNKAMEIRGESYFITESNLADVYTRMDNLPLAFQYAFSALKQSKEINDVMMKAWIYGILSRAYLKNNMSDSAIYYGHLGLESATKAGNIEQMRDNTLALSNAYASKTDFRNAYNNRILYANYRDSMMNEEVRNRTAVQQYTFNLDKKEAQIATLGNQKKYQRNLLIGAVALLFIILVSALSLLRNNRQKQKANKLLQKQKLEIDEKAQKLSEQKDNVELLNNIGRKTTSSLSIEKIIGTVYKNVNTLMDANIFGIGIYNDTLKQIEFPATYENGEPLPFYINSIEDEHRFGAVCFKESTEIIINNLSEEYKDHLQEVTTPDGGNQPVSVIFLPLIAKDKKLGVITVQSFKENAYSEYQLFMLRNIATYTAIAIDNAASYETLNKTLSTLKATQAQLIQKEKMASLGEITAGIAHEIQNPLNFVNNFSELNREMIDELQTELIAGNTEEAIEISNDIKNNEEKINTHGKRADAIVKGMLQHSRKTTGIKEHTDINALAEEYLKLGYHGLRAKNNSFNAVLKTDFDKSISNLNIVPQDISRVLLNLYNNAFYAVDEKLRQDPLQNGGNPGSQYLPTVSVNTKKSENHVLITVSDNGIGIPQKMIDKIFQPFFTTKPTGQGTGLGLSLSYDIIKAHGGEMKAESKEGVGTEFIVELPLT